MRYVIPNAMREEYIATHKPFKSGRMRGIDGAVYGFYGRLPSVWQEIYKRDRDDIVYTVMSYDTPIAWLRVNVDGTMTWFIPWVNYSSYSSVHIQTVMRVIRLKRYVSGDMYETVKSIDIRFDAVHYGAGHPAVFPHRRMISDRTVRSIKTGDYVFFSGFGWCYVYDKYKDKQGRWIVTTWKYGTRYYEDITDIGSFLRD